MYRALSLGLCGLLLLASARAGGGKTDKELKIDGKLTADDPIDDFMLKAAKKKCPSKVHEYKMKAGSIYVIDMSSTDVDSVLRLEDADKKMLAFNDDYKRGSLDSRIVFKAPKDGAYRIIATCLDEKTGAYTLTVRAGTKKDLPKNEQILDEAAP